MVKNLIDHALESEDELSSSSDGDSESSFGSNEMDGTFNMGSSYFDIYD